MTTTGRDRRVDALRLTLAVVCAVAFVACSGDDDDTSPTAEGVDDTTTVTTTEAVATSEVVETTDAVETTEAVETTDAVETTRATTTTTARTTTTSAGTTTTAAATTTTVAAPFPFTSPDGDYTVEFPGEPTPNEQAVPLPDGTTLPVTFYIYESGNTAAGTARVTYAPGTPIDLGGAVEGSLANLPGATLVSTELVALQGRTGLQFTATFTQGSTAGVYIGRYYADGSLLYETIYVGTGITTTDPAVVRFFESFRFTEDR